MRLTYFEEHLPFFLMHIPRPETPLEHPEDEMPPFMTCFPVLPHNALFYSHILGFFSSKLDT